MTPEEILESMKIIKKDSRDLINKYNNNWEELEGLRSEYKRLTNKSLNA